MVTLGLEGYLKATQAIMAAARAFAKGLADIPCLEVGCWGGCMVWCVLVRCVFVEACWGRCL
jgi:glutamate/tyrosine decarboxylase-like PLP-dependent enzyme